MNIIETTDLSFRYSSQSPVILNNVNIQVPSGSIYGFLGPNGAGKSTTLRLILGLLKNTQGTISVFGKSFEGHRIEILSKTGSLIENPSIYEHLTARENLQVLQKIYRCPDSRLDEVLQLVGLADTHKKRARQFSLGMKQRLAIALAILHHPPLLVLDEPTNGLDPNGIIEVRELLKRINKELGTTILISSHLLAEIEKLVTHIGIIHQGNMLFQGTLDELTQRKQMTADVVFVTSHDSAALCFITKAKYTATLTDQLKVKVNARLDLALINRLLLAEGIDVFEIKTQRSDLESIFVNLINE